MKNSKLVFSTDDSLSISIKETNLDSIPCSKVQKIRLHLDRKGGGKITTVVKGFLGKSNELKSMTRELKKKCASGGSIKNNEIIIQGNKREIIQKFLIEKGYDVKFSGG